MRTACYARFSSDLQRQTSLVDQVRNCQEHAACHEWVWQTDQIFTDSGISGASIEGRPGLQALLTAASEHPRPFDVLLVDDSSRISRDLADALRIVQHLKFAGVRVIYISQGVDSDSEQHETLIAVHGLVDGLYLREMAAKIKRGLRGQLARGFATGSKTYGYRSVPVPDPNRAHEPSGFRLEIEPEEADAIRRIFEWYANGTIVPDIITRLVTEGRPAPRGKSWRVGAIQRVLRNPKYTGQLVWGRTQRTRKPGSRTTVLRSLPPEQWQTQIKPELRIVSDELWHAVQKRIRARSQLGDRHRQPGRSLLRGRDAQIHGRALFTGFLHCGVCGKAVGIVGSHTVKSVNYRYYGCTQASRNGDTVCTNQLKIRDRIANAALLAGLQTELTRSETVDYISAQLTKAVNDIIDQRPPKRVDLERAREMTQAKLANLVTAIEAGTTSSAIFAALNAREDELRSIDIKMAALEEPIEHRMAVIPTWVETQLKDSAGLVSEAPERARAEFLRLGLAFTLHPVYDEGAPFLRAVGAGNFECLAFSQNPVFPASDRFPPRSIPRTAPRPPARPSGARPR